MLLRNEERQAQRDQTVDSKRQDGTLDGTYIFVAIDKHIVRRLRCL